MDDERAAAGGWDGTRLRSNIRYIKRGLQIKAPPSRIIIQVSLDRVDDARATYTEATKLCKDSIPLWLLLADLEVIVKK